MAHPLAFRYWNLCAATPGYDRDRLGVPVQLRAWHFASLMLDAPNAEEGDGMWPADLLVAQWTAAVRFLLERPDWQAPNPRGAAVLEHVFSSWWAALDPRHVHRGPRPGPLGASSQ